MGQNISDFVPKMGQNSYLFVSNIGQVLHHPFRTYKSRKCFLSNNHLLFPIFIRANPITIQIISRTRVISAA